MFEQIAGLRRLRLPRGHAASFALISYVGSYLRCHYIAEFTCSLLNAQPMGFYSAATIVEDARRHGVAFRAIDLRQSEWECTLEPEGAGFAIRMGLLFVKGLGERERGRIATALAVGAGDSLEDFVWESNLDEKALAALAEAGAFDCFGKSRREALWAVRGAARVQPLPLGLLAETLPKFQALSLFETINWDYERSQHSSLGHPLGPLRPLLAARRLPDARTLMGWADGERVRYAGVVICRQRPGTAAGVTFMTMEDETGFVNLVIWTKVFERYKLLIKTASFLGVTGSLQVHEGVVHLIAQRFWLPDIGANPAPTPSYDFH